MAGRSSSQRASANTQAVLLAAGIGSRLGGVAKCLFPIRGVALVDRCIEVLAAAGLERLLVVTGHGAGEVRAHLERGEWPLAVQFLHNPRYAELNNFHTLRLAAEEASPGRLLVLNGDIVVRRSVVADSLASGAPLVLAVEEGSVDQEALKVEVRGRRVVALGKGIPSSRAFGEFIGVSALGDSVRQAYVGLADEALHEGETSLYYEDVYSRLAAEHEARPTLVRPGTWAEIDTPDDVAAAEAVAGAD